LPIIDFHCHLDDGWGDEPTPGRDAFIAAMDQIGVDKACIFTLQGFYRDTQAANERLLQHANAEPDRLIPFVTVDPKLGDIAIQELDLYLGTGLFRGVKFHSWVQSFAPSIVHETMSDILDCVSQYDVPVLFHDGTPPYSTSFQIADLARQFPKAKIVLGHAGLSDYVFAAGQLAAELPNLYLCCCGPKAGELPYLIQCAGSEKVLFGSDFGIADWTLLADRLDDVQCANLSEAAKESVLYKNAVRLLRLAD